MASSSSTPSDATAAAPKRPFRALPAMLKGICEELDMDFTELSHGWIHILQPRNKAGGGGGGGSSSAGSAAPPPCLQLIGGSFPLNSMSAVSICRDKAATATLLAFHGVPCIPGRLVSGPNLSFSGFNKSARAARGTMPQLMEELAAWPTHGLVLKPNRGHSGQGVMRARNQLELERAWSMLLASDAVGSRRDLLSSPYVPLDDEWRCIVLDGVVRLCFRKVRPHLVGDGRSTVAELAAKRGGGDGSTSAAATPEALAELGDPTRVPAAGETLNLDWRHNVCKGSVVDPDIPQALMDEHLQPLARATTEALGARFVSVDIVRLHPSVRRGGAAAAAAAAGGGDGGGGGGGGGGGDQKEEQEAAAATDGGDGGDGDDGGGDAEKGAAAVAAAKARAAAGAGTEADEPAHPFARFADAAGFMVLEVNGLVFLDGFMRQHPEKWEAAEAMFRDVVKLSLAKAEAGH